MQKTWFAIPLCALLLSCHQAPKAEEPQATATPSGVVSLSADAKALIHLQTAPVAERKLPTRKEVLGQITHRSEGEAVVHATLRGEVVALHVSVGDHVAQGQPLATIASSDLGEAQAAYLKALGEEHLASRDRGRILKLMASDLASKKEMDESEQRLAATRIGRTQAAERLRVLGYGDADMASLARRGRVDMRKVLRAPKEGTVVERHASMGDMVGPDQEMPLFKLLDLRVVRVEADLPERDFLAVRVGQQAKIRLEALKGATVVGRVVKLSPTLEASSRTGRAYVDVPNSQGTLRPGMSAAVVINTGWRDVIAVPVAAVQREEKAAYAYVPLGGDNYREVPLSLGERLGDYYEAVSGLKSGETVVTKGSFDLRSQARKAQFGGE